MFTSEPSLAQRIERMIGAVPIVDTRSELSGPQLHAPDLAALIEAPPVRLALGGVGMPAATLDPSRPPEDRVAATLPFLRAIRNTTAAWCLFRIFRDLYDFDEPHLTPENSQGLMDRVAREAADPDRARQVIQGRARVHRVVAPSSTGAGEPAVPPPDFVLHRFEIVAADIGAAAPADVRGRVFDQLDRAIEGPVRFAAFPGLPDLDHPVHAAVLAWHETHQAPVQVVLDRPVAGPDPLPRIVATVARFPSVRFGLMTGSAELGPRVAALAGRLSNVFAEGFAGWGAWPSAVESNVLARVQHAGATKIGGFASGATSAEWVYGALQATRKGTASALAQAVASGFFEEDEIPPLLHQMFAAAPTAWYLLSD